MPRAGLTRMQTALRVFVPFERSEEEAVHVVPVGPGARGAAGEQKACGRGRGFDLFEVGVCSEESGDDLLVLFPLDRAGGVDEPPAGADDARGLPEYPRLDGRQLAEALAREAPAYLRVVT